ncbi:BgTH12-02157 [Blumeria graminis f. sp. triticale]|uniref:Bgt-1442 n=3 Tax=Blumeria graminis TaxID=34373 RepID=A0A381L825_BLUGR|nr:Mannose-containing glycoprotein [Blumeria graminis f. sp. tritici 96224]CAD6501912.1 BgTH12-02157 [Blumeria graminis f. sp. triticale]VDB85851.1 Bgt-1442 [Blumeria graminis f. sp. tritici]
MQTVFVLAAAVFTTFTTVVATPSGCSASYDGPFQITVVKPSTKRRDTTQSTCGQDGYLTLTLAEGQLTDAKGRVGYIASNYQFQFDAPPQINAASVGGYSSCSNGSLALAESSVFYQCLSGDFYNLYDRSWAEQCEPINIDILPCTSGASTTDQPSAEVPVSQINDGQPQATSATTRVPAPVSQISDGQPQAPTQAPTRAPVSQISDGQPQAPSATPHNATTSAMPTGKPTEKPSGIPVSQISDGQPQAPHATMKSSSASFVSYTSTASQSTATSPPISAGGNANDAGSIGAFIIAALGAAAFL